MAWLTRTNWTNGETPDQADFNAFGLDIRTWGGNVDAAGHLLTNCAGVNGPTGANPLIFSVNGAEAARFNSAGKLGVGTATPVARLSLGNNSDDAVLSGTTNTQGLHLY